MSLLSRFSFVALACLLPLGVSAFFSAPETTRLKRQISLDVLPPQQAQLTVTQTISNPTDQPLSGRFWFPLPAETQSVQFFVDAAGESFEILRETERLEALFSAAKSSGQSRFFRLAAAPFSAIFRSEEFFLPAQKTRQFKLQLLLPLQQQDDFWRADIFTHDSVIDAQTEISASITQAGGVAHFFSNLPPGNALADHSESGSVFLFQQTDWEAPDNLHFWWSSEPEAILAAPGPAGEYVGHFVPRPTPASFETVTLLIDRSGSMSGSVWFRVRELLQFLFSLLSEKSVRVAFFDTKLEWVEPSFVSPDLSWQESFLERLTNVSPVGATDPDAVLSELRETEPSENLIILLTDDPAREAWQQEFSDRRLVIFSFTAAEQAAESSQNWSVPSWRSGGFFQRLFRSAVQLIEKPEILQKWNQLREPVSVTALSPLPQEQEILPETLRQFSEEKSPFFVGRILRDAPDFSLESIGKFLSRSWAERRIAGIFETLLAVAKKGEPLPEDLLDAVLSIGRIFGVETSVFSTETVRDELRDRILSVADTPAFHQEIQQLSQSVGSPGATALFSYRGIPFRFLPSENIWRTISFLEEVRPERLVKIAPFSQAQKELFLEFPEIFSSAFGVGMQTEFCTFFRCFSVRYGHREASLPTDRAFLRDFDPHHWAVPSVVELVQQGVFVPAKNGKLHLDRAIDRGEFLRMLFVLQDPDFSPPENTLETFSDVSREQQYFLPIEFYARTGVVSGYKDGSFRPLQELTRAEAVKILLAADGFIPDPEKLEIGEFNDALGWEKRWVNEAVRRGLVSGYSDGTFRPHREMTRAEAAKVLVEWKKTRNNFNYELQMGR